MKLKAICKKTACLLLVVICALTLTVPAMFNADHLFCVVPAASKAEAVKGAVFGPVSEKCPASILRRHKSAILYTDKDSAKYIMDWHDA